MRTDAPVGPRRAVLRAVAALLLALLLPVGGAPAAAAAPARWSWPVVAPHPVVRAYLAPATPYGAGHRGIDVGAAPGSAVTAPDAGVVVFAGRIADRGVLSIEHAHGVRSSFEPVASTLHRGDAVQRGQVVAVVAPGGAHGAGVLHIGARVGGAYVSPLLFLGGLRRAVLLPMAG